MEIALSRTVVSYLVNGAIKTQGLNFIIWNKELDIEVVNSKGDVATGYIRFPQEDIPAVIGILATFMLNTEEKL